jgi:predicted DNA-binding transcriptional regulator YafY
MKRSASPRRRPAIHITLVRAARLHRLVVFLAERSRSREEILSELKMGLRTFYRELDLLKRCSVQIVLRRKLYTLTSTAEQAEGRLPFPDPQLSFAEMAELSRHPGEASQRLAALLAMVVEYAPPTPRRRQRNVKSAKPKKPLGAE